MYLTCVGYSMFNTVYVRARRSKGPSVGLTLVRRANISRLSNTPAVVYCPIVPPLKAHFGYEGAHGEMKLYIDGGKEREERLLTETAFHRASSSGTG